MLQQVRAFPFELEDIDDNGTFSGYVSVFGEVDAYRTRMAPGAFTESLRERQSKGKKFPILFNHDRSTLIGTWNTLRPDERGLYGVGDFWIEDSPMARIVNRGVKDRAIDGLSVSFYEKEWTFDEDEMICTFTKVELIEASVVLSPAVDSARIDTVRAKLAAGYRITIREFEESLRDRGFSRSEAEAIAAGGFKGFARGDARLANPNVAEMLLQLDDFSLPS